MVAVLSRPGLKLNGHAGSSRWTWYRGWQLTLNSLLHRIPGSVPDEHQAELIRRRMVLEQGQFEARARSKAAYDRVAAAKSERARAAATREALEYDRAIRDYAGKIEINDRNFAASLRRAAQKKAQPAEPAGSLLDRHIAALGGRGAGHAH